MSACSCWTEGKVTGRLPHTRTECHSCVTLQIFILRYNQRYLLGFKSKLRLDHFILFCLGCVIGVTVLLAGPLAWFPPGTKCCFLKSDYAEAFYSFKQASCGFHFGRFPLPQILLLLINLILLNLSSNILPSSTP